MIDKSNMESSGERTGVYGEQIITRQSSLVLCVYCLAFVIASLL